MSNTIPRSMSDMWLSLQDALDSIEINVQAYCQGKRAGWLAVASQLYVLLCDPNPKASLLSKLMPQICFHPLSTQIERPRTKEDVTWLMHSPAPVKFTPEGVEVKLFDLSQPKLPMKKWLQQVIGVHHVDETGYYVTIENLIYYSRNQLGPGHLDWGWKEISQSLRSPVISVGQQDYPFYEWALVMIGDLVIKEVRPAFGASAV